MKINHKNENTPYGYFVLDQNGSIRDANPTVLNWLGYEHEELIHTNIEALLSIASKMIFHTIFFLQLQLNGQVDDANLTIRTRNGQNIPVMLIGNRENWNGEEVISCIVINMAKRYDYEKELRDLKAELEVAYQSKDAALDLVKKEKELFNTTLRSVGEGIILVNHSGEILLINDTAEQITGYTKEEVLNKKFDDYLTLIHVHTRESAWENAFRRLQKGERFDSVTDFALIAKDGTEKRIRVSSSQIKGENREGDRYIASFRDINREYELEKHIQGFLDVNIDMLCVADTDGKLHKVNKKFEEVLGYKTDELEGQLFMNLVHPDDIDSTISALGDLTNKKAVQRFTNRYRCKDGTYKYIEWFSQPGVGKFTYSSARDVTPHHLLEEQLRQAANKDELTGLFNRHYFESILNGQMNHSDRYDEPLSMVLLDLDHFKQVNDTWGHPVGDELLKLTAQTVGKAIRESDILVRLGGEEFAILMPRTSIDGAFHAAEKIRIAIESNPLATVGIRTASLGAAERMKAESFRHWYRRLDGALYQAKQTGRNQVVAADGTEELPIRAYELEWRLDLQSGNNEIDQQHQELFDIGNRLIDSSFHGANQEEILKQLDLLLNHIVSHFAYEEKILEQMGYPDFRHHGEIHKELISKVLRFKESYVNGEIKASAFFSFLADDVILSHVLNGDMKFFSYVK